MSLLHRIIPLMNSSRTNQVTGLCFYDLSWPVMIKMAHTASEPPQRDDAVVQTICSFLRKSLKWDELDKRLGRTDLTNSLVGKVLIKLKEPPDAERALCFFHWSAHHMSIKHETYSYSLAIHILVRAKLIKDARALLHSVLSKTISDNSPISVVGSLIATYEITSSSPFVFDLLVQTLSKLRLINDAVAICSYLDEHGFKLSSITYNTLIHVVQKSDQAHLAWSIYGHMIKNRTWPNEATIRIMVGVLCKEGKLQKFVDVIDRIHGKRCLPGVIVNTCLVLRMIEEGRVEDGLLLLKRLLQKNMILDTISFSLIVLAKLKLANVESALEVYEEMLKRGFNANSFVYTAFIEAYCESGRIDEAVSLIEEMENVGLKAYGETFVHLMVSCSKRGRFDESLKFCERMRENGFIPSCLDFNEMLKRLCLNGYTGKGDEMLTLLLDKGFVPDENTYCNLIVGYGKEEDVERVLKLYYEMEYRSFSPGLLVFSSIIVTLCNAGRLEEAEKYLMAMEGRSLAPSRSIYDTLIATCVGKGEHTRAQHFFNEMVCKGLNTIK